MKTWNNVDKSEWPDGGFRIEEWLDEPDKAHWVHEGFDCLIVRSRSGALCGYVGVPESHDAFDMDYDNVYDKYKVSVHGGLTYAGSNEEQEDESRYIWIPNKKLWWIGFDCAHAGDFMPLYDFMGSSDIYCSFEYVKREVESLAKQLQE